MKRISRFFSALVLTALSTSLVYAASNDPNTFLGPTVKGRYTTSFSESSAYSVAGEVGIKDLRIGGTWAWKLVNNQRFKLSAEYLSQRLTYAFFSGDSEQWVSQGAIGAGYEYDLSYMRFAPLFDMTAYYSHAPSKSLNNINGTLSTGAINLPYTDIRRIAGSDALSFNPGLTFRFLPGTSAGFEVNYDNVQYDTQNGNSQNTNGFGGTVHVHQVLAQHVELGLIAAVRKPYNNYGADLGWTHIPHMPNWTLGIDGGYVVGKNNLPNSYNVGVVANYSVDPANTNKQNLQQAMTFISQSDQNEFTSWAAKPAVYMPVVLAVMDEQVQVQSIVCTSTPTFSGTIGDFTETVANITTTVPTAGFFTGKNLTYTISFVNIGLVDGSTISVNPSTGVVSLTSGPNSPPLLLGGGDYNIVVTATNPCGASVNSNTFNYHVFNY